MAGRETKRYARRAVSYRLMEVQVRRLDEVSKITGKNKTAIVEEALGIYFTILKRDGVI